MRASAHGFEVRALPLAGDAATLVLDVRPPVVAEGDVAAAADALGRPHRVEGPVVEGDKRGRELGYPTANLALDADVAIPADGVYAGWLARADGERLPAAISIGTNPTFGGTVRRVEAYALDRDDLELYGERVGVEFAERLRPTETLRRRRAAAGADGRATSSRPARSSAHRDGPASADEAREIEGWFVRHGLPFFVEDRTITVDDLVRGRSLPVLVLAYFGSLVVASPATSPGPSGCSLAGLGLAGLVAVWAVANLARRQRALERPRRVGPVEVAVFTLGPGCRRRRPASGR